MGNESSEPIFPLDPHSEDFRARVETLFRQSLPCSSLNGIAHDANNFLGAMLAYAELIGLDKNCSEETRRMTGRIIEAATQCGAMINSVMVLARREQRNMSAVDPVETIQRTLLLRQYSLKSARIKLETSLPATPSIRADDAALQRALLVLLINAEENVGETLERWVRVSLRDEETGISVAVRDSGPPLTRAAGQDAFRPWQTSKPGAHLGLGLALAQEVAATHQGTLQYSPEEGFVLALPREPQAV